MTRRLRAEEEMVIEQPLRSTDEGKVKLDWVVGEGGEGQGRGD